MQFLVSCILGVQEQRSEIEEEGDDEEEVTTYKKSRGARAIFWGHNPPIRPNAGNRPKWSIS